MQTFLQQMEEQIAFAKKAVLDKAVEITSYTFSVVVRHSPVLTSNFIQNWNIGPVADFSYTQHIGGEASVAGAKAVLNAEIQSKVTGDMFLKTGSVFMCNGTSYSDNIESLGWTVTRAYQPITHAANAFSAKYS